MVRIIRTAIVPRKRSMAACALIMIIDLCSLRNAYDASWLVRHDRDLCPVLHYHIGCRRVMAYVFNLITTSRHGCLHHMHPPETVELLNIIHEELSRSDHTNVRQPA